ncbi:MAG: nuclear transport factor 2 family protein [Caulobacteraceae bacterium]
MNTQEIGKDLVELCRAGKFAEAGEKYWADNVVSIEAMGPPGMDREARGKAAVRAKGQWWSDNHEVHSAEAEGPFVNGDQFAVRFHMSVTVKASGQKMDMTEVGLYTLKDGKIAEERFFYGG